MKTLLLALTLAASATATKAEPRLLGTWRSDREASLAFAARHPGLPETTHQFLEQLLGHLTLSFTPGYVTSHLPDMPVKAPTGAASQLAGFSERHPYRMLNTTATQVNISTVEPVSRLPRVMDFHFDTADTMWVELPSPPMPVGGLREYFVRVR